MSYDGSEDFQTFPLAGLGDSAGDGGTPGQLFGPYDIGGTNAVSAWADIADFDRVYAMIAIGTFNASDKVTTFKLQQATSSAGAGVKDVTSSGTDTSSNFDNTYGPGTAGNKIIATCRAEDLDANNGFHFVRVYVAATGNTGTDNVGGFLQLHNKAHKQARVQGATIAANSAFHYVTPHSAGGL